MRPLSLTSVFKSFRREAPNANNRFALFVEWEGTGY